MNGMKIICETCNGDCHVEYHGHGYEICPNCKGQGYQKSDLFFKDGKLNPRSEEFWKLFPDAVAVAKDESGKVYIYDQIVTCYKANMESLEGTVFNEGCWISDDDPDICFIQINARIDGNWSESLILRNDIVESNHIRELSEIEQEEE